MARFKMLVRVLDGIRAEAGGDKYSKLYATNSTDEEGVWAARSRAYVHLYIKVMFGVRDFAEREKFVTDGAYDAGIDGFYVDYTAKTAYLIQSKFRRSQKGFETIPIEIEELLAMQVRRVLDGEITDPNGNEYNGKIKGLQRILSDIPDIGRYSFKVVILANISPSMNGEEALSRLTDRFPCEIFDYNRAYSELLLPVVSGNLFKAKDISISLDISSKSSGSKINYNVSLSAFECDITVVFVPLIEIARLMSDYQNSILEYNPRSYLEFIGKNVNQALERTVLRRGNDFAILNNGITLICDESSVSEHSGKKNKAQLYLLNPQIINGGQTAFTLSRIYEKTTPELRDNVFSGKEVLVKAIALTPKDNAENIYVEKESLIERISAATNTQTAVSFADRRSNDQTQIKIQMMIYEQYGILVEIKRGEFNEGLRLGYIEERSIVERTLFRRLFFIAMDDLECALRRNISRADLPSQDLLNAEIIDRLYVAISAWRSRSHTHLSHNVDSILQMIPQVYATVQIADTSEIDKRNAARQAMSFVQEHWQGFLENAREQKLDFVQGVTNFSKDAERLQIKDSQNREKIAKRLANSIKEFFLHPIDDLKIMPPRKDAKIDGVTRTLGIDLD